MKRLLKQITVCVLSLALCFSLLFCRDFLTTSSAATNQFTQILSLVSSYKKYSYACFANCYATDKFTVVTPTQSWQGLYLWGESDYCVYGNDNAGWQASGSEFLFDFNLSDMLNFSPSNSSFSLDFILDSNPSLNIDDGYYTKFTCVVADGKSITNLYWKFVQSGTIYYNSDITFADFCKLYSENPSDNINISGFYQVSTPNVRNNSYNVSFNCSTSSDTSNLECLFVFSRSAYQSSLLQGGHMPLTMTVTPFGNSLKELQDKQYQQTVIDQNNDIISQNDKQIEQGEEIIGSDEEGKESGIKGLLKKVKELPQTIAEKLKELFVPTDEQLEDYQTKMKALLTEHLGAVYQSGDIVTGFFQKLKDFSPYQGESAADYDLKIKAHDFYVNVDDKANMFSESDNGGSKFSLIPVGSDGYYHIDFSFLDNKPYKQLYSIYRAFVTVFFIFLAVQFFRRKFNSIIGGDVN